VPSFLTTRPSCLLPIKPRTDIVAQLELDPEAMFVALSLVPNSLSRNKFFSLYSNVELFQARRRAQLVRQIVSELSADPSQSCIEVLEEEWSEKGLKLVYQKSEFDYRRTTYLSPLEAAVYSYALGRAGLRAPEQGAKDIVFAALARIEPPIELPDDQSL
jgi:hypothetical protein